MTDFMPTSNREQSTKRELAAVWPDGWYLYENGKLNGPLAATDAFGLPPEADDGSPRLISRKGFTQWYPLQDFAKIFQMSEGMAQKIAAATSPTTADKSNTSPVQARKIGPTTISPRSKPDKEQISALRQAVADYVTPSAAPASPLPRTIAKAAVLQEYFLARGRLGLGKLRSPWASAVGGWMLSLGFYWCVWFVAVHKEIEAHTQGSVISPKWLKTLSVFSLLPIANIWFVYSLATRIRDMETQNKYTHTRPALAAMLAIMPPAALAYLQSSLNRHWMLHAKHLILKRRADAAAAAAGTSAH